MFMSCSEHQERLARTTEQLVLDAQDKPESLDTYQGRLATFSLVCIVLVSCAAALRGYEHPVRLRAFCIIRCHQSNRFA